MNVIQIVPKLPPAINGLGDYALNLARQLRQDFGIETQFIVADRSGKGESTIEGFSIRSIEDYSSQALLSLLSQISTTTVLLHYVGYGYAKRGCPVWLVDGLEKWHSKSDHRQLITMFHEVCASSDKPWHSSFWLSYLQKNIAARLARSSDRILTSKQLYAEILGSLSQGKHLAIPAMPVFSNIGEPKQVPLLSERQPWLVIFGGSNNRQKAYLKSRSKITHICQVFGLDKIIDIGLSSNLKLVDLDGIPIIERGELSNQEIESILLNSMVGFLDYNPDYLAKSGIFAAYSAHGMLIVNAKGSSCEIDRLKSGRHYLVPDSLVKNTGLVKEAQAIANHSFLWYQNHQLKAQAKVFATEILTLARSNSIC